MRPLTDLYIATNRQQQHGKTIRNLRFKRLACRKLNLAIGEGRNTNQHLFDAITRYLQENLQAAHAPAVEEVYEIRTMRGWTLHINRELLAAEAKLFAKAMDILDSFPDSPSKTSMRDLVDYTVSREK